MAYIDVLQQVGRLRAAGEYAQARQLVQRNLQRTPRDAGLWVLLGALHMEARQVDQAEFAARKAVEIAPAMPATLSALAQALVQQTGKEREGADLARRSLAIDPRHAASFSALTLALHRLGELHACRAELERACQALPNPGELRHNYARLLLELGRGPAAMEQIELSLRETPNHPDLIRFAAMASHYSDALTPEVVFARHRAAGALADRVAPLPPLGPDAALSAGTRRIRVGFVSADFRSHSVASFIEPLLRGLDRARFEPSLWWNGDKPDEVTQRLRGLAEGWHDIVALSDPQAAKLVRDTRIDVLCDLSGYTGGGRPGVFSLRPARAQLTMIGYPGSTGSRRFDARLVDAITDPPGAEAFATEPLVRLPGCFLCYQPPRLDVPVVPRRDGPIVFGSFNNAAKISAHTARLWRGVLDAAPGSRLLLKVKGVGSPEGAAFCREGLTALGLDLTRIDLTPHAPSVSEHLAQYSRVDIALDTFPYHGTTTTCEALWMGVPVVTRLGAVHAARVSASLLRAAGLDELVADDDAGYIRIATQLAADQTRLAAMRRDLRSRLERSALCDATTYAAAWAGEVERVLGVRR
ncbi:MAG: glycosyltransferase [Planctomycetota bacterium]|nr:glycosyltransferase [Planctomycetota bacterium]